MSCLVVAVALLAPACGGGAETVKEKQVELPPADPRAVRLFVAGARLMKQGKDGAARARFERALKIDSSVWGTPTATSSRAMAITVGPSTALLTRSSSQQRRITSPSP